MRPSVPFLWSVVLAAGRGTRLAGVTGGVPKQFWAPTGHQSLLEETLARLAPLVDSRHIVTVVDESHHEYIDNLAGRVRAGDVIFQPHDRGTAVGVLLATVRVWSSDPEALILVTPSDHGVANVEEFRRGVHLAYSHAFTHIHDVVLLGAEPQSATGDYGWIVTRGEADPTTAPVEAFVEKPEAGVARELLATGAMWNTMVVVARAEALLDLYRRSLPDVAWAFERLRFLPSPERESAVGRLYGHLPSIDFSSDVLSRVSGLRCLVCRASMGWTDLGTPERLDAWLASEHPVDRVQPGTDALH